MSNVRTPVVGDIVIVRLPADLASVNNGTNLAPAVVTRVWTDDMVNVKAFLDASNDEWLTSVRHEEESDNSRTWYWPGEE